MENWYIWVPAFIWLYTLGRKLEDMHNSINVIEKRLTPEMPEDYRSTDKPSRP